MRTGLFTTETRRHGGKHAKKAASACAAAFSPAFDLESTEVAELTERRITRRSDSPAGDRMRAGLFTTETQRRGGKHGKKAASVCAAALSPAFDFESTEVAENTERRTTLRSDSLAGDRMRAKLVGRTPGRTPRSARVPLDPPFGNSKRPTRASAADLGVRPTQGAACIS